METYSFFHEYSKISTSENAIYIILEKVSSLKAKLLLRLEPGDMLQTNIPETTLTNVGSNFEH